MNTEKVCHSVVFNNTYWHKPCVHSQNDWCQFDSTVDCVPLTIVVSSGNARAGVGQ